MTTEEDFQLMLDANPEDWLTRIIFADWLQENGDRRAAGYRELGIRQRMPILKFLPINSTFGIVGSTRNEGYTWINDKFGLSHYKRETLPRNLWDLLNNYYMKSHNRVYYLSRREAENSFALAFALYGKPLRNAF